jgi:hypothetical protein
MPVQHTYTMKAGTKSKLLLVYATSADGTSGKTGLPVIFCRQRSPAFGRRLSGS